MEPHHPHLTHDPEPACLPFSLENIDKVMIEMTGSPHLAGPKLNTSANPGWKEQMTSEHLEALSEIPAFHTSLAFINW